ncbi:hypothetical protein [Actinoplanes sp. NPDC026619]|uniref:hypothetical protein n=1 Tax=Actinoplanes sp. NPDC026619 TaxID=3155798 RepID=UPI0033EDB982
MINVDHGNAGRRRGRKVAGVAGLAALLGAGAFLVTDRVTHESGTTTAEPAPPVAMVEQSSGPIAEQEQTRAVGPAKPAVSTTPKSVQERAGTARNANKRLGTEVRHPNAAPAQVDPAAVKVREIGSSTSGRLLKVSSSWQDLSGYRELAWARDGRPYGSSTCTQTFTPSQNSPAEERPSMLLCWRTSSMKSVYTLAVDRHARPSKAAGVAEIDKAWATLR